MVPSLSSAPRLLATLLVLNDLRPLRQGLQQVFEDLEDPAAVALEDRVRRCGSAPVFTGDPELARGHARRLQALGLTTSLNLRVWPQTDTADAQGVAPA